MVTPPPSPTRVLLVEDDARFADVVRRMLVDDGYDVVGVVDRAGDVEPAIAELHPQVIVLDLVLPGADGIEVAEQLQAAGRRVPVILFSSLFDQRVGRESLAAGYGYVEKAAGIEALELAIDGAVDLAEIDLREAPADRDR